MTDLYPEPTPEQPQRKQFDADFRDAAKGDPWIEFELRGVVLRAVRTLTLVDQDELSELRRTGQISLRAFWDRILYSEEDTAKFWTIAADRERPVPQEVYEELTEWLMSQISGGRSVGKLKS